VKNSLSNTELGQNLEEKKLKKGKKTLHTLRKKKSKTLTHSPPSISLGTGERKLLAYLYNNRNQRFNVKAYSRIIDKDRSCVYYLLSKLIRKGLVRKPHIAEHTITGKGISFLEATDSEILAKKRCSVGVSDKLTLSTHFTRYILPIKERSNFSKSDLSELNPLRIKEIKLPNFNQHIVYFEDATIIISLKQVAIRIHDILAEDTEEAHYKILSKALNYEEKLRKINLITEGIILDSSHYARVNSILADSLKKIDEHYFIELKDGTKFWIDNSPPNRIEDETTSQELRKKIDDFWNDLNFSDSRFSDIDKIKESLGDLTKLKFLDEKELENQKKINSSVIMGLNSLSQQLQVNSKQIEVTNKLIENIAEKLRPEKLEKTKELETSKEPINYIG